MDVILSSKPGQVRTEPVDGVRPVEACDDLFGALAKARFVIAELRHQTRFRMIDEVEPPVLNLVPTKFLPRFDSIEAARQQSSHPTAFGSMRPAPRPANA